MTANQPNRRLGSPWFCVLTTGVAAAAGIAALHAGRATDPITGHRYSQTRTSPHKSARRAADGGAVSAASRGRLLAANGSVPLAFEANQGQTDARVKYLARGNGYTLF